MTTVLGAVVQIRGAQPRGSGRVRSRRVLVGPSKAMDRPAAAGHVDFISERALADLVEDALLLPEVLFRAAALVISSTGSVA